MAVLSRCLGKSVGELGAHVDFHALDCVECDEPGLAVEGVGVLHLSEGRSCREGPVPGARVLLVDVPIPAQAVIAHAGETRDEVFPVERESALIELVSLLLI